MRRLALAFVAVLSLARPGSADVTYLALGDSLAFGETDFAHNPSKGDRGYVSILADHLAGFNGGMRPTVVNLGLDGETTSSYTTGVGNALGAQAAAWNLNYPNAATTQSSLVATTIAQAHAAGRDVKYVTVSLGANDLYSALADPSFFALKPGQQGDMIHAKLSAVAANDATILHDLRAQLPNAQIALLGYYNPYPALTGTPIAQASSPVIQALNGVIAAEASIFKASYVDAYTPFLGHEADATYIRTLAFGQPNVHPNAAGYGLIGWQLSAVPEPSSVALLGLGLVAVAARLRSRSRRRAA